MLPVAAGRPGCAACRRGRGRRRERAGARRRRRSEPARAAQRPRERGRGRAASRRGQDRPERRLHLAGARPSGRARPAAPAAAVVELVRGDGCAARWGDGVRGALPADAADRRLERAGLRARPARARRRALHLPAATAALAPPLGERGGGDRVRHEWDVRVVRARPDRRSRGDATTAARRRARLRPKRRGPAAAGGWLPWR